jgi:hypothetical protein
MFVYEWKVSPNKSGHYRVSCVPVAALHHIKSVSRLSCYKHAHVRKKTHGYNVAAYG